MIFFPSRDTPAREGLSFSLSMLDSTFPKCRDKAFFELTKLINRDMYDPTNLHTHLRLLFQDHSIWICLPIRFDIIENKPYIKYPLFFENFPEKVQFALFQGFFIAKKTLFKKLEPNKPLWNDKPTFPFMKNGRTHHLMYLVNRAIAPKNQDHKIFWCIILDPHITKNDSDSRCIIIQAQQCYGTPSEAKLNAFSYLMECFAPCGPPWYEITVKIRYLNPHLQSTADDRCMSDRLLKSTCISEAVFALYPYKICCCSDVTGNANCFAHTYRLSFKCTSFSHFTNIDLV